jgi:hypothetical protein
MKPAKSSVGGANAMHPDASGISEKYPDQVGINAGNPAPGGSADAVGTERGFQERDASEFNPQNPKEGVSSEWDRGVQYGGQTKFRNEP